MNKKCSSFFSSGQLYRVKCADRFRAWSVENLVPTAEITYAPGSILCCTSVKLATDPDVHRNMTVVQLVDNIGRLVQVCYYTEIGPPHGALVKLEET